MNYTHYASCRSPANTVLFAEMVAHNVLLAEKMSAKHH